MAMWQIAGPEESISARAGLTAVLPVGRAKDKERQGAVGWAGKMSEGTQPEHSRMVRNHWWWRPGWRTGRRAYTFHVVFNNGTTEGTANVQRLVSDYQRALMDVDGLDHIPGEWLHLTMQGVGFVDEVSDTEVDAIIAAVGNHCSHLAPFDL